MPQQEQENDPYSLSFKPQIQYTSDKSPEKILRKLESSTSLAFQSAGAERVFGSRSANLDGPVSATALRQSVDPLLLQSPPKLRAPSSPPRALQPSSARKRSLQIRDDGSAARPVSSPTRTVPPLRPTMALFAQADAQREIDGVAQDVEFQDELDCLSPRKKKRSFSPTKQSESGSPTITFSTTQASLLPTAPTPTRPDLSSVAMQRSSGMPLPPAFFASRPPEAPSLTPFIHPAHFQASADPAASKSAHSANFWQNLASPVRLAAAMNSPRSGPSSAAMSRSPAMSSSNLLPRSGVLPRHDADMDDPTIRIGADQSHMTEANHSFDSDSSHNSTLASVDISDSSSISSANASTASIDSLSSGNTSMSSATTEGLARLQSMLSRLQMPRQSMSSSTSRDGSRAARSTGSLARDNQSATTMATRTTLGLGRPTLYSNATARDTPVSATSNARVTLSARRSTAPTRSSVTPPITTNATPGRQGAPSNTAARLAARKQAAANAIAPQSRSSATIAAMANPFAASSGSSSTSSIASAPGAVVKSFALKGVIAFVDVRTGEGDDAGMLFVDMLKSLGARVTTRPTATLTHIIWKAGKPLSKYVGSTTTGPKIVGIGWVVRCAELNQKVDETDFLVDMEQCRTVTSLVTGTGSQLSSNAGQQRRRKSMEPKALTALGARDVNRRSTSVGLLTGCLDTVEEIERADTQNAVDPAIKASIAASIDRARRKSLQFAPKVGSPLAKRMYSVPIEQMLREHDMEE
ncbi:hypothetical protein OIV83_003233 [Microbotryomycetes sp. JL201]|nr:hypothetical protein OIV83_003233 [Microbotryomycetes sp. JL201]